MEFKTPAYTPEKINRYIAKGDEKFREFRIKHRYSVNTRALVILTWLFTAASDIILYLYCQGNLSEGSKFGFYCFVSFMVASDAQCYYLGSVDRKFFGPQLKQYKLIRDQLLKLKGIYETEWKLKSIWDQGCVPDEFVKATAARDVIVYDLENDTMYFSPQTDEITVETLAQLKELYRECRQIQKTDNRSKGGIFS